MKEPTIHILEGSESDGTKIYACGRRSPKLGATPSVGRARLSTHGDYVTCKQCLARYAVPKRSAGR